MNKYLFYSFLFFGFIFSALVPHFVQAQITDSPGFSLQYPVLGINRVTTDEYSFSPGETKKINIEVENISKQIVDFTYILKLAPAEGDFVALSANGLSTFGETDMSDSIVLKSGEIKSITVDYKIPEYISDGVTLEFEAFNTAGIKIGSSNIFLKSNKVRSNSTTVVNSTAVASIEKVTLTQDDMSFDVDSLDSGYVLKEKTDLNIGVFFSGKISDEFLVSAHIRNLNSSSTFEMVYSGVNYNASSKKSYANLVLQNKNLDPGVYELVIQPIDIKKNNVGPSRKVHVGVEGVSAVINAFSVETNTYPVKKNQRVFVSGSWYPNIQISKRMLEDYVDDKEINETNFEVKIRLENEKGDILDAKNLGNTGPSVFTEMTMSADTEKVIGIFEVWSDGVLIASYKKNLIDSPLVPLPDNGGTNIYTHLLYLGIFLVVLLAIIFAFKKYIAIKKNKENKKSTIPTVLLFLLLFQTIPNFVQAQWVTAPTSLVASTTLQHRYPSGLSTAASWSALTTSPWNGVIPYSRGTTTNPCVRRSLSGTVNNNIVQNLPAISGNNRMYRWENTWHTFSYSNYGANTAAPTNNVRIWYWMNRVYTAARTYPSDPYWPLTGSGVVPGIWAKSSFIHQKTLDRISGIADNLDGGSIWTNKIPMRLSSQRFNSSDPKSILGTNRKFILATTTYSNMFGWLDARFNVLYNLSNQVTSPSSTKAPLYEFHRNFNSAEKIIPGSFEAFPPEENSIALSYGTTTGASQLLNTRKALIGSFSSSTMLIDIDAGAFNTYNRSDAYYDNSLGSGDSFPGNYNIFNFLHGLRDEANSATFNFDCFSSNMIVSTTTYKVIDNSHILLSVFYDKDEDGIKDADEITLTNQAGFDEEIDDISGFEFITNGDAVKSVSPSDKAFCAIGSSVAEPNNSNIRGLSSSDTTKIGVLQVPGSWGIPTKGPSAFVKSVNQVAKPQFYPEYGRFGLYSHNLNTNNLLVNGTLYTLSSVNSINTPFSWIKESRVPGEIIMDTDGKLNINLIPEVLSTSAAVCGNSMSVTGDTNSSLSKALNYQNEFVGNPVPSAYDSDASSLVGNGEYTINVPSGTSLNYQDTTTDPIAYWRVPVNSELDSAYDVGINSSLLPSGWSATTPQFQIKLAPGSEKQFFPVFLGIKYTANGVCGSAKNTTSGPVTTPPSANLCTTGSSTEVITEDQKFTWSCDGYGFTSSDAVCEKPKCQAGSPYYCAETNSCVADADACNVAGVCGSATSFAGATTAGPSTEPSDNLCSVGAQSLVAGQNDRVRQYTWTCEGTNGASTASCSQEKCSASAGFTYCANVDECRTSCPVTASTTLMFNVRLNPFIVRKSTDQCTLEWNTAASALLPVSCTLNGNTIGASSPTVPRSTLVPVGRNTLSCTNGVENQSTTTRCQLNPSFKEI